MTLYRYRVMTMTKEEYLLEQLKKFLAMHCRFIHVVFISRSSREMSK
jgi:hypothetical protein